MRTLALAAALSLPGPPPDPPDVPWPVGGFEPIIDTVHGRTALFWYRAAKKQRARYLVERRRTRRLRRTLLHRGSVTEAIGLAATVYGQSYTSMLRRATCESRLSPAARNSSSATGLFQLLYPSTWNTTPFRGFTPTSPYANALAAGYMLSRGRAGEWVCGG